MLNDIREQAKNTHLRRNRIALISFQMLDLYLSKTAYIELSKHLAERGNKVDFFALRSTKLFRSDSPNMTVFAVPLKKLPYLSPILYVILIAIILPFYTAIRRPGFVITEPRFGSLFFGLELKFFPRSWRPIMIMDIRSTSLKVFNFRDYLNVLWFNSSVITAKKTFDGFTVATKQMKKEICDRFHIESRIDARLGQWSRSQTFFV